jgi:hypothetical protein
MSDTADAGDDSEREVLISECKRSNGRVSHFHTANCQHTKRKSVELVSVPLSSVPADAEECLYCRQGDQDRIILNTGPGLASVEDVPARDPDAGEVWRSGRGSQGGSRKYHTERTCNHLRGANKIRVIGKHKLSSDARECRRCAGKKSHPETRSNLAQRLRSADDPAEVLGDE